MKHRPASYVFCLVQSARPPRLSGVPDSVPGAGAPRALQIDGDVWAIVADAPLDRFSSDALQQELQDVEAISRHALAHASVTEFFFRRATVIPLKLFTIFSSDEKVGQDLRGKTGRLRRIFAQLRGLEEWGVRIIAGDVEAPAPRHQPLGSGRDYLEGKKRLNEQAAEVPRAVAKETRAALKALGTLAAKVRKEILPAPSRGGPFVAGASFLVKAKRRARWKTHAAVVGRRLAKRGHRMEMSGPWPPYHFVSK